MEAPAGGATACKAYGPGLEGGNAGQPCKFTVITRDAGPGGLAVAVEGEDLYIASGASRGKETGVSYPMVLCSSGEQPGSVLG